MQRECPGCALDVDYMAEICPVCGYEFARPSNRFRLIGVVVGVVFLLPLVMGAMSWLRGCGGLE